MRSEAEVRGDLFHHMLEVPVSRPWTRTADDPWNVGPGRGSRLADEWARSIDAVEAAARTLQPETRRWDQIPDLEVLAAGGLLSRADFTWAGTAKDLLDLPENQRRAAIDKAVTCARRAAQLLSRESEARGWSSVLGDVATDPLAAALGEEVSRVDLVAREQGGRQALVVVDFKSTGSALNNYVPGSGAVDKLLSDARKLARPGLQRVVPCLLVASHRDNRATWMTPDGRQTKHAET